MQRHRRPGNRDSSVGVEGEVIVPSYTFVATPHALQWQEITPVFADIDPRTHNIDPAGIERLITRRTTGNLGVHVWGRPCDTTALLGTTPAEAVFVGDNPHRDVLGARNAGLVAVFAGQAGILREAAPRP